tara:strand:+ start:2803 stop:3228 length:426 start_codon:yes stop_codon:yes gene_type:complete
MAESILNKIKVSKLEEIESPSGNVMHALKKNEKEFFSFGEAYFSKIEKNKIKGWKMHKKMKSNLIVPYGLVKFVFYDVKNSLYREEIVGINRYVRLFVPPKIWFAFQGLYKGESIILNISNILHDPKEEEKRDINNFNYDW